MFNLATLKKAAVIGFCGTIVMTVVSHFSYLFNLPRADLHDVITALIPYSTVLGSWFLYFMAGIALAFVYRSFFYRKLPAHSWVKGIIYSVGIWMFLQVILFPILGLGFFTGSFDAALTLLMGMGLYGATIGYLYEHHS